MVLAVVVPVVLAQMVLMAQQVQLEELEPHPPLPEQALLEHQVALAVLELTQLRARQEQAIQAMAAAAAAPFPARRA